ncbi:MAG TPA: MarR family transcriptional regulator [Polyangiaceae bacterium LLY-WYZ-15_(1-7)]|nr:MarR family transcriptional regulator [Polyangiaceae bacterium LLY-WYZ-15_(1-7)]HJL00251.1 MarR family transcriptional regulator [Polyangiaceae bacterium LLY-WYZ-15_(1-7)]HJL07230.1 MarR family transcriptional regulator [Polyangiaceae bacterium LLY-WYZ-15_(1-7)]HJL21790.1 MarR family transcriptional regulator [Polyangiaceae bacterium LLY-WYZ-15_(1-7)]HJL34804.1 MarR family transcriptional regulator [Polyangiaceae bacterium LLY-WYZ-15_(1-7)]
MSARAKASEDPQGEILDALRREGPRTVDALRARLGLSKTATRGHLLRLERAGLVERAEAPPTAGRGRPPLMFRLTERGDARFPTRDGELLERLLRFLEREGESELVERFFEGIWRERRAGFARALGDRPAEVGARERQARLVELLERTGFMPAIERGGEEGRRLVVKACHCPLPAAVRATRVPCRLEARFVAEALGGRLVSTSIAETRREPCAFEVELEPPG